MSWTPRSLYRVSARRARDGSASRRAVGIAASNRTGPRFVSAPPIRDAPAIEQDDERSDGSAQIGANAADLTHRRAGPTEEAPADHDAGADALADASRDEVRSPRVVLPRLRYHSQQHSAVSPLGSPGNNIFGDSLNITPKSDPSSPWATNR